MTTHQETAPMAGREINLWDKVRLTKTAAAMFPLRADDVGQVVRLGRNKELGVLWTNKQTGTPMKTCQMFAPGLLEKSS